MRVFLLTLAGLLLLFSLTPSRPALAATPACQQFGNCCQISGCDTSLSAQRGDCAQAQVCRDAAGKSGCRVGSCTSDSNYPGQTCSQSSECLFSVDRSGQVTGMDIKELGGVVVRIINFLFAIIGSIAVLMIVLGGFRYIVAQGDPKAVDSARGTITFALAGFVVVILAVFIVNFVGGILGVQGLDIFKIELPKP